MPTEAQIQATAQQARSDLGAQYRQLRLQLKGQRGAVRRQIEREIGKARSQLEAQEQAALSQVRETQVKAGRRAELPGLEATRSIAKRQVKGALTGIDKARAKVETELRKSGQQAIAGLNKQYQEQLTELNKSVAEAQTAIDEWEKSNLETVAQAKLAQQAQQVQSAEPSVYDQAIKFLAPYKSNGGYDLVKAMGSGNSNVEWAVLQLWGRETQVNAKITAEKLVLEPVPTEEFSKLSTGEQEGKRPVVGVSIHEYADLVRSEPIQADPALLYDYYIKPIGVSAGTYASLSERGREYTYPELTMWQSLTPWKEELGQKVSAAGATLMGAEILVPGVYLGRHWGELSTGWKAGGIVLDLASFIPFVNIASWAGRAGAIPVKTLSIALKAAQRTKLARPLVKPAAALERIQVAAPRAIRTLGTAVIAEVKAPVTSILHPIETAKSVIFPVETVLRPKKLPIAATEIRVHTVKLPVSKFSSVEDVINARDILTSLAIEGKGATIEVGGKSIALTPTALQQTLKGAAIHTTPDIRPYLYGLTVTYGREGGLFVSPTLHTRFAYASAFGELPKGAVAGAVIIRDPRILALLQSSGKLYRGTAEIEKLLGAGAKLPAPSQLLITRDPAGKKIILAIIGKPLTKSEIAKLKLLGVKDTLRDIFAPAVKVKWSSELDELVDMGKKVKKLELELEAAKKAKDASKVARLQNEINQLNSKSLELARRISIDASARTPLMPIGLGQGAYITSIIYNEYATQDTRGFANFLRGLPVVDRAKVLAEIRPEVRDRVRAEISRIPKSEPTPRTYIGLRVREVPRTGVSATRLGYTGRYRVTSRIPEPRHPRMPAKPTPPAMPATAGVSKVSKKLPLGSVTWRQGLFWMTIIPPYGGKDVLYTRKPPYGAKIIEGPGSAYKTITKLGVAVPKEILHDMGIMDVYIGEHGGKIKFKRDVKQRTKLGYPKGVPAGMAMVRER